MRVLTAVERRESEIIRFWKHVQFPSEPNGCLLWTGSTHKGYGGLSVGSRADGSKQIVLAHVFAWELANGDKPPELCVLHSCDVRLCARADHLFLGTKADNARDMIRKGRQRYRVKLLPVDRQILTFLVRAGARQADVAEWFSVSNQRVSQIAKGTL